jgi:hypothetical protein
MNNTEPFSCKWRGCGLLWHRKTRQIRIEMVVQRTRTTNAAFTCSFRQPLRQRASSKSLSISHDTFGSAPTSAPAVTAQALTWRFVDRQVASIGDRCSDQVRPGQFRPQGLSLSRCGRRYEVSRDCLNFSCSSANNLNNTRRCGSSVNLSSSFR